MIGFVLSSLVVYTYNEDIFVSSVSHWCQSFCQASCHLLTGVGMEEAAALGMEVQGLKDGLELEAWSVVNRLSSYWIFCIDGWMLLLELVLTWPPRLAWRCSRGDHSLLNNKEPLCLIGLLLMGVAVEVSLSCNSMVSSRRRVNSACSGGWLVVCWTECCQNGRQSSAQAALVANPILRKTQGVNTAPTELRHGQFF